MCDLWMEGDGLRWYLQTCPWALINNPAVAEVVTCFKWFDKGQLTVRYPNPPLILLDAITSFENGYNGGRADLWEREANERKTSRGQNEISPNF